MSVSGSLFDTNIWVAITFPTHPHHDKASAVYGESSSDEPAVFCRSTQQSFLRVATTPAVLEQYGAESLTNRDAVALLSRLMVRPEVAYREESPGVETLWHQLAATTKASPKLWMDAYLAAFAIAGNYRLVTADRGFRQFKRLSLLLIE